MCVPQIDALNRKLSVLSCSWADNRNSANYLAWGGAARSRNQSAVPTEGFDTSGMWLVIGAALDAVAPLG